MAEYMRHYGLLTALLMTFVLTLAFLLLRRQIRNSLREPTGQAGQLERFHALIARLQSAGYKLSAIGGDRLAHAYLTGHNDEVLVINGPDGLAVEQLANAGSPAYDLVHDAYIRVQAGDYA